MLESLRQNLRSVIHGKDDVLDMLLAAMLADGHVLLEDMPGLGKTTLAKALAVSLTAEFRRVQFTADLLPTDVLGGSVYNAGDGSFQFRRGPIFTNVLLADEINRASPRTQSALLEAMAERQVTIEGVQHDLPGMFLVLATQNPIEFHGTYPLPEAQLDRFLVRLHLGYVDPDTERRILFEQSDSHPLTRLEPVADSRDLAGLRKKVHAVFVADEIGRYVVDLVTATREHEQVQMGASPRGTLGLFAIARAHAFMAGRDHVRPDDVQACAEPVLAHRLLLHNKAKYAGVTQLGVIEDVLNAVSVPI